MKINKDAVDGLLKMVSHLRPGGIGLDDGNYAAAWGFRDDGVHVASADVSGYAKATRNIYEKSCQSDYDIAEFEKRVVGEFQSIVSAGKQPTDEDAREFFRKLDAEATFTCTVTRDLRGAGLSNRPRLPLKLGPFTVYHYPSHKNLLISEGSENSMFDDGKLEYLIGVEVEAKTTNRAREKADKQFEGFERLLRFMIGPSDNFQVTVLGSYGRYSQNAYLFKGGASFSDFFNWRGPVQALPIDDDYFTKAEVGHDLLWNALGDLRATPLHKRLANAAQWLGDSYAERDRAAAFIKAAISLEVLLTFSEKAIINPSIMSSISEAVACLLGESSEERIELERTVKEHYGTRSAVAHAGKSDVSLTSLNEFRSLVRRSIVKVLSTPALRDMDSIERVYEHLKGLKYSFSAI